MESTLLLVLHYMRIPLLAQMVESACNSEDPGWIPGSGRSPGEGNGNPLQYSCLENSMDGGAWWATVHGVAKSWTQLSNFTFTFSLISKTKIEEFDLLKGDLKQFKM